MAQPLILADAGMRSGLGHLSRSAGIAIALRSQGVEPICLAIGAKHPFTRDGVSWSAVEALDQLSPSMANVVVLDSYGIAATEAVEYFGDTPVLVFDDIGVPGSPAALTVDIGDTSTDRDGVLAGPSYTSLRRCFWGMPTRRLRVEVDKVLVTVGGGGAKEVLAIIESVRACLPRVKITTVHGPFAEYQAPPGVRVLRAPAELRDEMLDADIVVCAAGQTMLEAIATGVPCVAIPLVENQLRQAHRLGEEGAVLTILRPQIDRLGALVASLSDDWQRRVALSRMAQSMVDGYGSFRIAFQLNALAGSAGA